MSRRTVAGVVLAGWLVAIGWLVRQEYWRPDTDPLAEAAFALPPSATYFALSLGGDQIGYASSTIDTLGDTLRVTDLMVLEIPVLGALHRTNARTEAVLSRSLRLREFSAWLRGDAARFSARGRVHGDTALAVEIETDASTQTFSVDLDRPIVLPALLPLNLAFGGELQVGKTYELRLFDPVLLADRDVAFTVAAESTFVVADSAVLDSTSRRFVPIAFDTVRAFQIRQERAELGITMWIDDLGQIVRATSPMGFTMERSAFEIAYENFRRETGPVDAPSGARPPLMGDVIRQTAIASDAILDRDRLTDLTVRLGGVTLDGFALDGDYQTLRGDTLTVRRVTAGGLQARYFLPATDDRFGPWLAPEPLIQSADPRLQALARQITGNTRRPERAARRLAEWVYANVEKQVTLSVPSALDVFQTRRGDCNEHTVLYVALARAVGLPARTAAGLTYVDGRFYYHAWPEVYLERWIPVDPTFGQFPADAARLRFTVGGLARQVELIHLIGRLTIDVVETS